MNNIKKNLIVLLIFYIFGIFYTYYVYGCVEYGPFNASIFIAFSLWLIIFDKFTNNEKEGK